MGKKIKKFITLSEVDHKLQFISVVAVIDNITPTISRNKLTKVVLSLMDETIEKPGFNVKLYMESETLNQFLNVAKRGFIIQLNDIKVTKNEGEVYGEVQEEEEITLYNDSPHVHKWYPQEKPNAVTDAVKLKIETIMKWKKGNFKNVKALPEDIWDKSKTRRSGLGSDEKSHSASKVLSKINVNDGSTSSSNSSPKVKPSSHKVRDKSPLLKENKLKNIPPRKNKSGVSAQKNVSKSHLRRNILLTSSEEESTCSSLSRENILSNTSKRARAVNLNKSSSLPSLNKLTLSRTRELSNLSRLNLLDPLHKTNKSVSLSKLDKSESQITSGNQKNSSIRKKLTQDSADAKEENNEKESVKSKRLNRSGDMSKVNIITISTDSDKNVSSEEKSSEKHECSLSSLNDQPVKKNIKNSDGNKVPQKRNSSPSKSKDILHLITTRISLRNKVSDHSEVKNELANEEKSKAKGKSKSLDSKTEIITSKSRNPQENQSASVREIKNNSGTVKLTEIKPNKKKKVDGGRSDQGCGGTGSNNVKLNSEGETKSKRKQIEEKTVVEEKLNSSDSLKRTNHDEVEKTPESLPKKKLKLDQDRVIKTTPKDSRKTSIQNKQDLPSEAVITLRTRNQVLEKSVQREHLKQTRGMTNSANSAVENSKEPGKCGIYETYLRSLTKKLNYTSIENFSEISLYDLEEIDVSEKFDLQCKILSEFLLLEEGIQVVRVQDGTICKCNTLKIPYGSSWDIVLKEVLDNPVVEGQSPYIDILIFNSFRLDRELISGQFFRINNIMALKFQLKQDPRQGKKSKSELFFCVEGQHAYVKKLNPQQIKELNERLAAESYKSACKGKIIDKAVVENPLSDLDNFKLSDSPKKDGKSNLSSDGKSPLKTEPVTEEVDTRNIKRKINNVGIEPEVKRKRGCPPSKIKMTNKTSETSCVDNKNYENFQGKINTTVSSDETMMGETPPLLREISEIMHEESDLGLPQTISEDIHLKNSGSEVTFSQFCEGAKLKGNNFRTSTQNVESEVLRDGSLSAKKLSHSYKDVSVTKQVILLEDSSKMEPLVYCPSSSSVSTAVGGSQEKGKSGEIQNAHQSTVSVIQGAQLKTISDLKHIGSKNQRVCNDNISDLSNSSSVKVISSNSSVGLDFEVLCGKESTNKKDWNKNKAKLIEIEADLSESSKEKDLQIENAQKKVSLSPRNTHAQLQDKDSESIHENGPKGDKIVNNENTNVQIEVVSDNSSNDSLFATENGTAMKPLCSFNASVNVDDLSVNNLEQFTKRIPDRCFFKSPATAPKLTELELSEIYDDENSRVKYFSYCYNRHLPMLTLDIVEKIKNTNSLTMKVTFISISPAFTDSWRETCVKARCPTCDKLYDVFNAANNKNNENASSTSAITVGSHIVCPDSQCCNQILKNPEFHFNVEFNLGDGTSLTALLAGTHAEEVFGCSAQEAIKNDSALSRVAETLEKVTKHISDKQPIKVVVKREDICDPTSGPLCLIHIDF